MERKIGEIFEYNGEWYQCVRSILTCSACEIPRPCTKIRGLGYCSLNMRNDKEQVVFKKLEKVGKPFIGKVHIQLQRYKIYTEPIIDPAENVGYINEENTIAIEIKENKEDMKEIKLKPFDLEAAKAGKPVCTRDGRKARIICFDRKDNTPIVALIECNNAEFLQCVHNDGKCVHYDTSNNDLMMLPEEKEGYINIYRNNKTLRMPGYYIFDNKEEAIEAKTDSYITTIKIEWEE